MKCPVVKEVPEYELAYLLSSPVKSDAAADFSEGVGRKVLRFHRHLPGYQPTRLVRLRRLARLWGVGEILVKDESTRFGLKAFKVLGAGYAVGRLCCRKLDLDIDDIDFEDLISTKAQKKIGRFTLACTTDGNHGRGVAWIAEQLKQKAVIFMPKGSVRSRVENIRSHGAVVEVTDMNYDDTVRYLRKKAEENGWTVIQDTAWLGYTEIPRWIMQGYMTLCMEAVDQMSDERLRPTHVFVQAGVGAFPGSVVGCLANRFQDNPPRFIVMEPNQAACIFASAAAGDGLLHGVRGDLDTIMAGLACGEPNPLAWEILRDMACGYIRCADFAAANGIRILASPLPGDQVIEAGESGSVGIGLLDLLANRPELSTLKKDLAIGSDSCLLFVNTEGATDPDNYRKILWQGKYPST